MVSEAAEKAGVTKVPTSGAKAEPFQYEVTTGVFPAACSGAPEQEVLAADIPRGIAGDAENRLLCERASNAFVGMRSARRNNHRK
jgi:hypothetical protein